MKYGIVMKIIKGDLIKLALSGEAEIIVHGCNCFHAMGSGIAGALGRQFPQIPLADSRTPKADPSKLGTYTVADVTRMTVPKKPMERENDYDTFKTVTLEHPFKCINLYTQYVPGAAFIPSIFPDALKKLNKDFKGKTLWFPMIGCGIGGGDWAFVMNAMLSNLTDVDLRVVVL